MNRNPPKGSGRPDLHRLLRNIIGSFTLALLGSWGLIVSRLSVLHELPAQLHPKVWFWVDLACLAVAIYGILCVLWYNSQLGPRLRRLRKLGEADW
ncbi:MAG: hypothetical protein LBF40_09250 [Deltaproteobacteria bacterium]|jgi:hypothetical protein|nr:hypothetical protein [Deltaproteobacteria bacterium]